MGKCALVLAATAVAAAGCGSGSTTPATAPATTTTHAPAPPASLPLTVFEVRDGSLRPVLVHVPRTRAVAAAALAALRTPAAVTVADGTAHVDLATATDEEVAGIVYTLTRFPTIRRVDVAGRSGLTRHDFDSYLPPILVEAPAPGAEVPRTFRVSGSASVFEATLVVEAVRDGTVVDTRTVTASEGAPARGAFETTLVATPGRLTVRAFAPSAADGSPQHQVDVAVEVKP